MFALVAIVKGMWGQQSALTLAAATTTTTTGHSPVELAQIALAANATAATTTAAQLSEGEHFVAERLDHKRRGGVVSHGHDQQQCGPRPTGPAEADSHGDLVEHESLA